MMTRNAQAYWRKHFSRKGDDWPIDSQRISAASEPSMPLPLSPYMHYSVVNTGYRTPPSASRYLKFREFTDFSDFRLYFRRGAHISLVFIASRRSAASHHTSTYSPASISNIFNNDRWPTAATALARLCTMPPRALPHTGLTMCHMHYATASLLRQILFHTTV
jgi:hypothetical protein